MFAPLNGPPLACRPLTYSRCCCSVVLSESAQTGCWCLDDDDVVDDACRCAVTDRSIPPRLCAADWAVVVALSRWSRDASTASSSESADVVWWSSASWWLAGVDEQFANSYIIICCFASVSHRLYIKYCIMILRILTPTCYLCIKVRINDEYRFILMLRFCFMHDWG